jgi:hypothetical protein
MVNKTVKVRFSVEEWYPVYEEIEKDFSGTYEVEMTQYELFKLRRTLQEFQHVQAMIKQKIEDQES